MASGEGSAHLVVDEVHALVPNKRGADLAVSLERLAAKAANDPTRVGLSATCRPPSRSPASWSGPRGPAGSSRRPARGSPGSLALEVESLLKPDEGPHRGLTYRRLLRRLREATTNGADDRRLRQHPGVDREGHPRPPRRSWGSAPRPSPPTTRRSTPTGGGPSRPP